MSECVGGWVENDVGLDTQNQCSNQRPLHRRATNQTEACIEGFKLTMLQGEEGGKDREPQVTSMVEFVIVLSRFLCGALLFEQIEKKSTKEWAPHLNSSFC